MSTICIKITDCANERKAYYWCHDTFGPKHQPFSVSGWWNNGEYYFFYNESDAVLFLLHWPAEII